MQHSFNGNDADTVWQTALTSILSTDSSIQSSRNGDTYELLHTSFHIKEPRQRWILSRTPPISPAFAIAEVFWILSGSNDASFINYWNPLLPKFAGTTDTYYGAYGYRLRNQYGIDQIENAYQALSSNSNSRQVVLQIWDPRTDLPNNDGTPKSPDIPCNICSILKIRNRRLEWLQVMRSNDIIRGTPYNFIQFTTLQEILAGWLEIEIGSYTHISDSLHAYSTDLDTYSISSVQSKTYNSDNLRLSKKESDKVIHTVMTLLKKLTVQTLRKNELIHICNHSQKDLPLAYSNLLMVTAADSARRRGWNNECLTAISNCTNAVLREIFLRWKQSKSK